MRKQTKQTCIISMLQSMLHQVPGRLYTPDFKWQGWSNGGKNQNLKKIPGPKFNPQKIEFPSHKNFQRNYATGIRGNYHNIPTKPTKIKLPKKKQLPKFSFPKKLQNLKFQTQKSFNHSCHLKSRVLHPLPHLPLPGHKVCSTLVCVPTW